MQEGGDFSTKKSEKTRGRLRISKKSRTFAADFSLR